MFRGFFDECNRRQADGKFAIAGWVATQETWDKFAVEWQSVLVHEPSIRSFKSSEANGLNGEFFRHAIASREAKKLALAQVICRHPLRGYVATVDHLLLLNKPKQLKKLMGTRIYDWAFIAMVSTILVDFLERGERTRPIHLVFDQCTELPACIESYELRKAAFPRSMQRIAGLITGGDDREVPGLQAADFLAGEYSASLKNAASTPYYSALNALPIREFAAAPPPLDPLLRYATQVHERAAIASRMIKHLKSQGIKLDDIQN